MNRIIYPNQQKYLSDFDSSSDELLLEMEKFAVEKNIPILAKQSAKFIEQVILIHNPKRVLEIGTAIAYTSIRIARLLKKKRIVDTIEKSEDNISLAESFIEKAGLKDRIHILKGEAFNIIPQLTKKYDFIFLDADKQDYKRLLDYSLVLLKKGGVIVVDNLLWHGFVAGKSVPAEYKISTNHIKEFNKIFLTQPNLRSSIQPIGDGLGIGIKI
ncbi:MAG: O-methyltransferase [Ignavibacteriales bacterium]|nr:O-methyltransferase [Ignavibacteriales bacterium]